MDLDLHLGFMCTAVFIGSDPVTPPPHTHTFRLIYDGAVGQPRKTTSLCDPLVFRHQNTIVARISAEQDKLCCLMYKPKHGRKIMNIKDCDYITQIQHVSMKEEWPAEIYYM
jgi:hypothetical protein